jgi:hypothetical protein
MSPSTYQTSRREIELLNLIFTFEETTIKSNRGIDIVRM